MCPLMWMLYCCKQSEILIYYTIIFTKGKQVLLSQQQTDMFVSIIYFLIGDNKILKLVQLIKDFSFATFTCILW